MDNDNIFDNPFEISEVRKVVDDQHHDKAYKTIGDRVRVIDYSSMSHMNGDVLEFSDYDELEALQDDKYFVVCEIKKHVEFKTNFHKYKQDLVVANPQTKKQYRIISGHVKLHE